MKRYGRVLFRYMRPQWRHVLLLALFVGASIALQLINPQLVRRFLDAVEQGRSLATLLQTAVLFVALALMAQAATVAGAYVGENVAWRATNALRADLALHCLKLDMGFHKRHKPGELIERVDGDVNQLANFFSQLVIELTSNLLLVAGVLVLLWALDWRVGLSVTLLALLALALLNRLNQWVVPRWQRVRQMESDLFGYLEEWISGTEEIQTSGAAPYTLRRLYRLLRRRWRAMQRAMRMNLLLMFVPIIVPALAYMMAYWWGDRLFRSGTLTLGGVYLIFYYIGVIRDPLWSIQRQVQDLQRAAASLNRILSLFAERASIEDRAQRVLPPGPLALRLSDVSFHYADDPSADVLRDIDFYLAPGRVLGLLGRTGSGKTTLTRLLLRFYDPTRGRVAAGTTSEALLDLRDVRRASLRSRVGMVTQEVQLFHATVRANLTLFDDTIDDAQILTALDELGLTVWLESLPAGLDTRLDGSAGLSAGEAQLLALGRVFLSDVGLVILDEASARLDPATETMLEKALDRLLRGRTAIIIAHRLATVMRADEIMVLENGAIAELGERAALMRDPNSRFAQLLRVGMQEALV